MYFIDLQFIFQASENRRLYIFMRKSFIKNDRELTCRNKKQMYHISVYNKSYTLVKLWNIE